MPILVKSECTLKRLDQGHLHPKLEVPRLTYPGPESNPGLRSGRWELYRKESFWTSTKNTVYEHTLCKERKLKNRITRISIQVRSDEHWIWGICKSECLNHVGVTTMKRLDQGHFHSKLEVPRLTCPGPPQWEASILEKSHSNSLCCCQNLYSTVVPFCTCSDVQYTTISGIVILFTTLNALVFTVYMSIVYF
jgi:hypothetical protein